MRIMLVDDSPVVRLGLRTLLETEPDLEVVAEAGDGDEALALAAEHQPEVVLLDVRMPRRDGLSVVAELVTRSTVLMVTFSDEHEGIRRALADGAAGYLVHGTFDAAALSSLVRAARAGVVTLTAPAQAALSAPPMPTPPTSPQQRSSGAAHGLSPRQVEVMDLVASGLGNGEIAKTLFLAEKTVKNHINQIFAALGVSSRAEAIVYWLRLQAQAEGTQ